MTATWGQDDGVLQNRGLQGPAGRPSRAMTESLAAVLALAGYVLTFGFAGNGCWVDVAAGVGIAAVVGYCAMLVPVTRHRAEPTSGESARGTRLELCARGALAAAAVLIGAAAMNVVLYAMTGFETLGARVVALLFIPLHCCLLVIADVMAVVAIAMAADARGARRGPALRCWLLWFNASALLTFVALRGSGLI
jgi:hypothetical protein